VSDSGLGALREAGFFGVVGVDSPSGECDHFGWCSSHRSSDIQAVRASMTDRATWPGVL
jgi:hypothetical protein